MSYSVEELQAKKTALQKTEVELQVQLNEVLGTNSIVEVVTSLDLISVRKQITEIDAVLGNLPLPEDSPITRRELIPTSPTILVTGIPPTNGIPSSAVNIVKKDGSTYFVSADGKILQPD
jgi:hypothetical protein